MSAISETYNRAHSISDMLDMLWLSVKAGWKIGEWNEVNAGNGVENAGNRGGNTENLG